MNANDCGLYIFLRCSSSMSSQMCGGKSVEVVYPTTWSCQIQLTYNASHDTVRPLTAARTPI